MRGSNGLWQDSCKGDSGGPLTWTDITTDTTYLLGALSWGPTPCGKSINDKDGDPIPVPGVYARISDFTTHQWIKDCIESDECGTPLPFTSV